MSDAAPKPPRPDLAQDAPWLSWVRSLAIAVAAAAFLAFAGPFNTASAPWGAKLGFWGSLMVGGALWGHFSATVLARVAFLADRLWATATVLTVVIATPFVFVVWVASSFFFHGPLSAADLPAFVAPSFAISAVMTTISLLADRSPRETHAAAPDAPAPKFLERLPLKLRGAEIYAVEAEDHYLRVHTDRGSDLILMRLGDAVSELNGIEGAQTHRSWWVAREAVTGAARGDGRAMLTLKNGVKAPVSRTYARALRHQRWY
jgi:DNA-binding LytR/AlgR family response regulator